VRKGRLELWLGAGCVGLVLTAGLLGLHHRHLQALYYRWQFLHGEKATAKETLLRMTALDPEGKTHLHGLVVGDPEHDLTVLGRQELTVTVRNDRRHRVYVGSPDGKECFGYFGGPVPPERRDAYIRAKRWLEQGSDGSAVGLPAAGQTCTGTINPLVRAALAWLAAHAEPDPQIVSPHRVLDPGETADFWVGPER
jgi:hypothetical protein